jgi:hypothetical protein
MCAAERAVSVEVVRVLLSRGADIAATRDDGATAMEYALEAPKLGAADQAADIISLLTDVRTAGSWKHYTGAWRVELLLLQRLCADGRAYPGAVCGRVYQWRPASIEDLEATSGCKVTPRKNYEDPGDEWRTTKALMACLVDLPPPLVGKVASYWRTARDPRY